MKPRKLEHGFRMIGAAIPLGHEDNDLPSFWLLPKFKLGSKI